MENILEITTAEDKYEPTPDLEGAPLSDEEVLQNIKDSEHINVPIFKNKLKRKDTLVYIGGGPSMTSFVEEIRQKKEVGQYILTSNMTYDWLVERGIICDAVLIIDPKERVSRYVNNPQHETDFYIGAVCNKGVANGLIEKGANVTKLLVAYGMPKEEDIELQKEIYKEDAKNFLVGGTMTGLRVMNFAVMMGFKSMEVYGVDSCYGTEPPNLVAEDDPRFAEAIESNENALYYDPKADRKYAIYDPPEGGWFYAYKKKHHGALQIARCPDGRQFWTSPVFAHQAKQFLKWHERFEDKLHVKVHGDNLTSHLIKCHRESLRIRKKKIGNRFWTDEYHSVFKAFFSNEDHLKYLDIVTNAINDGALHLSKSLGRDVTVMNYDRIMIHGESYPNDKYDVVHTTNLMEHIEPECIDNVLKDIKRLAKYMVVFNIGLGDSNETLTDGRDAHIFQKSAQWWSNTIENYFDIVEGQWRGGEYCVFVCQSLDSQDQLKEEHDTTT